MSLQESWQQQRQQRQQELLQRQQAVQQELAIVRQERQIKAVQLRDDLSLFREMIASGDKIRRANFQLFQVEMRQFCQSLQVETRDFLYAASDRRRLQAQEIAIQLDAFVQALRQQSAQFLAMATAERLAMAEQLEKELTAFVAALRIDVQSYLWEMETVRQQRATQLQQELAQSRVNREADVAAMFQRLAQFRLDLRQFCTELRSEVWGNVTPVAAAVKPNTPKPVVPKQVAKGFGKAPATATSVSVPSRIGAFPHGDSIAVVPAQSAPPPAKDNAAHEKDVYNFIHEAHGARLTQIESSLGINRFQAVDALRSLIKKGLITQRDRIYITQEDLAHT